MKLKSVVQQITSKKIVKWSVEVLLIIAIILAVSAWQARNMLDSDGSHGIATLQLVSLQGEVQPLFHPDRRTLVYFWAPWCSICAVSIGSLNSVGGEELDVVTIAMDFDSIEAVQAFVDKHEVHSRVLLGNEQLRREFKIQGYPSYYLLNEDAKVVAKSFGLNTSIGIKAKDWMSRF